MTNGEKSVNPLRDEASLKRSGNQRKKDPLRGSFFSYRPSAGAHRPSAGAAPRSVVTQQSAHCETLEL